MSVPELVPSASIKIQCLVATSHTEVTHEERLESETPREEMASVEAKGETVMVTGASGFIGSTLVRCLLDRGYNVHAGVLNPGQ